MRLHFFACISLLIINYNAWSQKPVKDTLINGLSIKDTSNIQVASATVHNLIIGNIKINGNRKTKEYIIRRELLFKQGDIIDSTELVKKMDESEHLVFNTALFIATKIYITQCIEGVAEIQVDVKERWYLFPLPYFRLVSRNFNEWWVTEKRSLSRVNYGIKFIQSNVTGQNDELNIWLINGYNTQLNFRYSLPFFDKEHKRGFSVGFVYSTQKEINYTSSFNKQIFFKSADVVRTFTRGDVLYSYRPDQHWRHYWRASFSSEQLADTVLKLNTQYSPGGLTQYNYVDASYTLQYLNLNYNYYPSHGYAFDATLYKRHFKNPLNLWQVSVHGIWAKKLSSKLFFRTEAAATLKFPNPNAFNSNRLFGFGNFVMRGLEYYVAEGTSGVVSQNAIHFEAFKYVLKNPFKSKTHDKIPFTFYLKAFSDFGYCNNPQPGNSLLSNKLLRTYGLGLDIVSIYDFVFRIEYSFNQLGGSGLFVQTRD